MHFQMIHSNTKNAKSRVCQSKVCCLHTTHSSVLKAEFILERKRFFFFFFFYRFVAYTFQFFEVKSILPIDRYQNATSKAISLYELKKVQLQERYTRLTQDSIGHLKTLCMSVLSLVVALESE